MKNAAISERYRFKGSLAKTILFEFKHETYKSFGSICFNLSEYNGKFSDLERLKNQSGYLALYNMEIIYSKRWENRLAFSGFCDNGETLDQKQMQRMFKLPGTDQKQPFFDVDENVKTKLENLFKLEEENILEEISIQDSNYFDEETKKIDKWANDIKIGLELNLRETDKSIDEINVKLRARSLTLKQRLELQEKLCTLESKRKELRMKIYEEQDKIDDKRKKLIEEAKKKLILKTDYKRIFVIRWEFI